jgi:acetyl-CoA acetyltransferase
MTDAYILGGVRTPVGRYGGSLSHIRTDDLLGQTMVGACEKVGVPLEKIEDIAAGCVNVAHEGMGDVARWGALAAGFPDSVPAVTLNRFCASSLTGAISVAHAIRSDELGIGLAAGVESMSRSGWANMKGDAPFSPPRSRAAARHHVGGRGRTAQPRVARAQRVRRDDQDGAKRGGSVQAEP